MKLNNKRIFLIAMFWLMIYCLFTLSIGRFIPIYFQQETNKVEYYLLIHLLTVLSFSVFCFSRFSTSNKNKILIGLLSFIMGLSVSLILAIFTLFSFMFHYSNTEPIYINKTDPSVKIVSRYFNEGAYGGGTEPADFETAIVRPFTSLFILETIVDTNKIDKSKWVKTK